MVTVGSAEDPVASAGVASVIGLVVQAEERLESSPALAAIRRIPKTANHRRKRRRRRPKIGTVIANVTINNNNEDDDINSTINIDNSNIGCSRRFPEVSERITLPGDT